MYLLEEADITCPYCGETISVLIDSSLDSQSYVEDCSVCCRPIVMGVEVSADGSVVIRPRHEDEA